MIGFVREVLRVLAMPCKEHATLFTKQLDEPLTPGTAAGLRLHILYCGGCRRFRAQVRRLHQLAGEIGQELQSAESMPEAVRERLRQRTAGESRKI